MQPRFPALRRLIPWVLGTTLAVLALLAITRIVLLRDRIWTDVRNSAEEDLRNHVDSWESRFLARMDTWLANVADRSDSPEQVQAQLREQSPWVESIAVWRPARITRPGPDGSTQATMIFPVPRAAGDQGWVINHPCLGAAARLPYDTPPREIADAYLAGCIDAPAAVRLEASIEASTLLERAGRMREALDALDATTLPRNLSLETGLIRSIPAGRLVAHRSRRAELLMAMGEEEQAMKLYYETGEQIADLDAPDAEGLETWRWALLDELRQHDRPVQRQRLERRFNALDRRIRALREIRTQVLPEAVDLASSEPRLIRDQYADQPYLLYYGIVESASGERLGVAIQLDQSAVLNDFLNDRPSHRDDYVIVDASGTWVLGTRHKSMQLAVQVPFSRTLTHLRVGIHSEALEAKASNLAEQWVIPLIVTTILLIIGFFALSFQIAAQRRLSELLARQREFTTRVTHELKTPIAGIKVMAENLEIGAFRGDAGRERMARRIVEEADRLTSRIDEVLAATRERTLPEKETFDLDEVLFELIEVWAPRMDQQGVAIELDLDEAPEVHGDREAVRDAIGCLLDNALKYRDPDKEQPEIWVGLHTEGRDAVITVKDNGLGVPPRQRSRIFEQFARVEGPNRGLSGGHGLGLAQVAATAKAHHGNVVCTDGVDGGAKFTLRLRGVK